MIAVIKRYGFLVLVIAALIFAVALWIIVQRHNTSKTPTRGVYVENVVVHGKRCA